jgi:hypothetical protein
VCCLRLSFHLAEMLDSFFLKEREDRETENALVKTVPLY